MKFQSFLPVVEVAIETASVKAIWAAANEGRTQTVKNLTGARHGRRYRVPGTGVYYTASAPGEFPAVRTGALRGSVRALVQGGVGYVGTDLEYGLDLEKKPPSRGGREWLRPSLEKAKPAMLAKIRQRWF